MLRVGSVSIRAKKGKGKTRNGLGESEEDEVVVNRYIYVQAPSFTGRPPHPFARYASNTRARSAFKNSSNLPRN
jgi:hypothetical protein